MNLQPQTTFNPKQPSTFNLGLSATRSRSTKQPSTFNLQPSTLAFRPRDRVQPNNLGLSATRSRSTKQPATKQPHKNS
ncbi:hypothetical protein [Moorena producens]|uniref:hypothetical protein n=1 Tax=Moorena producens TaxID=1155739 RepID=UPI0011EA69CC|nr:hypothetical protein [Moorena producens]